MVEGYSDNTFKVVKETFFNEQGEPFTVEKHYRKQARGNFFKHTNQNLGIYAWLLGDLKGK